MVQPSAKTPIADLFPPADSYISSSSDSAGLAVLRQLSPEIADRIGDNLMCFAKTGLGHPEHPLYLPNLKLERFSYV